MITTNFRKSKVGLLFILALFIIMAFRIEMVSANAPPDSQQIAHDAGLAFVSSLARHWNPGWTDVRLTNPRPTYELDGEEIGYRFTIKQGSNTVGTLIVGSQDFSYRPLELVPLAPLDAPDSDELSDAIDRDLDLDEETGPTGHTGEPIHSDKLLYIGYQRKYELYEIDGSEFAFDLVDRSIMPKDELQSSLSQTDGDSNQGNTGAVRGPSGASRASSGGGYWSAWEVLTGVPIHGQYSSQVDAQYKPNNCGPTTGAMIVDYYRIQQNYSSFDSWTDNHDTLYDTMDTDNWCPLVSCPGTPPGYFARGWREYADDKGYDFSYSVTPGWAFGQTWNKVTGSIDDERPLAVMFASCGSAPDWHWNAIKGYGTWVDGDGDETDYMVVNDPGGSNGFDGIVSWSANWRCLTLVTLEAD